MAREKIHDELRKWHADSPEERPSTDRFIRHFHPFIFNRMEEHIGKATGKEQVRHKHSEIKMVTRKARAELIRGSR